VDLFRSYVEVNFLQDLERSFGITDYLMKEYWESLTSLEHSLSLEDIYL